MRRILEWELVRSFGPGFLAASVRMYSVGSSLNFPSLHFTSARFAYLQYRTYSTTILAPAGHVPPVSHFAPKVGKESILSYPTQPNAPVPSFLPPGLYLAHHSLPVNPPSTIGIKKSTYPHPHTHTPTPITPIPTPQSPQTAP